MLGGALGSGSPTAGACALGGASGAAMRAWTMRRGALWTLKRCKPGLHAGLLATLHMHARACKSSHEVSRVTGVSWRYFAVMRCQEWSQCFQDALNS